MSIILILILSNVVNAVTQCEVDQIKQALRKMLYRFYTNHDSAPFSIAEVKDLLIFYLSIDPNAVTIDCSMLGSKSNKAIFDIVDIGKNVSNDIPKCTDGTQYGQCSGNRPKYCYAGAIYEKCETCGCPSNSICGKSGKCESTIQNITCYNNIDCGTNKFVGDYYCSSDSIYKNLLNYTCVNAGIANASCASVNGSVWIAYCNPSLNQVCVNGQNTCQTITKDNAPTVSIAVNPTSVAAGQTFNVTVTGTDDIGLAAIWWWAENTTDLELNKAHWYSCYGAKICTNSWLVSTSALGTIKLGANSRDVAYPIAGEHHQASEGAGIAYAVVTVGATQNISGGLPDLIISDFKSYTGTTNTYVTISATIKNIGGSVTVGNLCDSLYVETLNARGFCGGKLNPGETRVIQSDYALHVPGTYKIRADTDYGLLVAESNENNNVAWQTITVTSPYSADYVKANTDLTVIDIDVQLPTTSSGTTNVYVTTKNLGSLATGQYWVLTKVTNVDTGKITNVQRLAPIVQPGGTYSTHHGSVSIIEYGTYKVEAFVDLSSSAYIFESNEDNNYMVKTIVYGNVTTKQCSEGAIPSSGCLCQGVEKNSGYCCYSYLVNQLVWTNVPCTQTCTSEGGVCCAGAASDCVGSWSGKWATDCQGYSCCIGKCTGTCYGPSCNQTTTATCSWAADNICPSGCAAGSDADCCTQSGKYVLIANLTGVCQQACYSSNYTAGTTPCLGCSSYADGACPNWCSAGSDADCCTNVGKCWRPGQGCYDTCVNETIESVSLHNLSIVNENLIVGYSKNFITCVHLVTSNYGKTSIQNYYCTEGNNIAVSQPVGNFNVTVGQSYKLCHGNNYNICSSLKTLVNLTSPITSSPDLIVDSMTFEPINPTASDLIKINITVKNTGTATAGSSVLQVNYDPGWYTRLSVPSLSTGASYSWLLSWTLAANSYTFTAVADKDSQISEQNENNNALVKSLIVTAALNQSTNNTNQTSQQTCTGVSKTVDFENPPHLSFHLTWNPDLGAQDSYNYNLDGTARTWLKGKGLVINGTPNGIVWGTQHSGPAGTTGVVIGDASPNFVENDQGISDNEILSVRFIDALTKSVTVGLTVMPSTVSSINNIPATVVLEAYDTSNNIVDTATKTFTGVTNSVYTPTTMSLSATDFKIAKITLRTTQHPYGGVWLEDVTFLSCT